MRSARLSAATVTASLLVAGAWLGALVATAQAQVPAPRAQAQPRAPAHAQGQSPSPRAQPQARAPAQPQAPAQAQAPSTAACEEAAEVAILPSPLAPWKGAPLRLLFVVEKPLAGELSLIAPNGSVATQSRERFGGPPYFWYAEVATPAAGKWLARLARDGATGACSTITREIAVSDHQPPRPHSTPGSIWPLRHTWTRAMENLYSAWIEKLFDAPLDASPSWAALHEVLRDRSRNMLFNHMGLNEDAMRMVVRPDCADLPYFLRAYFAFKMGLPFGYSICSRGGGGRAPTCPQWWNIENPEPPPPPPEERIAGGGPEMPRAAGAPRGPAGGPRGYAAATTPPPPQGFAGWFAAAPPGPVTPPPAAPQPPRQLGLAAGFGQYIGSAVAGGVHSGSGRTAATDDRTDYYPVPLTQENLRPGTVYADPYGHLLVLAKRVPQTDEGAGVFLAVDAQPDGTVARKRFWRGNFLFAQDRALGEPRLQALPADRAREERPAAAADQRGDREASAVRRLLARSVASSRSRTSTTRMDDVMSPAPLDPLRAMKEAITSLEEQVKTRVTSVENGRKYQNSGTRRGGHAGRRGDLRDHRRVGGFRDAVARSAPADRDRRGAQFPGARRAAARALRDAEGQERRRR